MLEAYNFIEKRIMSYGLAWIFRNLLHRILANASFWNREHESIFIVCINYLCWQQARWLGGENIRALLKRNCVLIDPIIGLRQRINLDLNYSIQSFNSSMESRLYPPASLFMTCKERYSACLNRALLDRESCIVD